ncbi:hypothetical protein BC361_25365 [Ensifer sp. LC54]|nr:hypothetical protein BC361_25365 [Ensifer sp. LC54]OCP23319.1 hypothetical protein BC363_25400 [Ensifer sp. LC384]
MGVYKQKTGRNLDGEETYGPVLPLPLSVVRLAASSEKTSVRSDSSASRGQADQMVAESKILTGQLLGVDDLIELVGMTLRVVGIHPRFTVSGALDHYEVSLEHVAE